MMELNPNTGDNKMDEAYDKMKVHVAGYKDFESFYNYFQKIVTTDDQGHINKWLLKVLYVDLKNKEKHDFDKLLEQCSAENAQQLKTWLDNKLKEVGGVK